MSSFSRKFARKFSRNSARRAAAKNARSDPHNSARREAPQDEPQHFALSFPLDGGPPVMRPVPAHAVAQVGRDLQALKPGETVDALSIPDADADALYPRPADHDDVLDQVGDDTIHLDPEDGFDPVRALTKSEAAVAAILQAQASLYEPYVLIDGVEIPLAEYMPADAAPSSAEPPTLPAA